MRFTIVLAVIVGLTLVAGLSGSSVAGPAEDGDRAYIAGDYANAIRLWRPLAEGSDRHAQFLIGSMYASGRGVLQDFGEAARWYRLAAEQGLGEAQSNLGYMYFKGHGVLQDYVQAHKWYNLAGANGEETGRRDRDIVAKKMTAAQIAEAQKLAREWMVQNRKK